MEKITDIKDFFDLKHGDILYRFNNFYMRKLSFVGFMPRNDRYLIFCEGEYLTHLYLAPDNTWLYEWYKGEYDSVFVGQLKISNLRRQIEIVENIYLKEK